MSLFLLGFASTGFAPNQVSGLQLWLDATRITGLADGAAVATWADVSGNGRNATQGTGAAQPLYKTNIINGKPVVRFDGTDDLLDLGDNVGDGLAAYTCVAVYKRASYAAQKALYSNRHLAAPASGTVTYWGAITNLHFIFQDSVTPSGGLTGLTALTNGQAIITAVTLTGTTRTLYTNSKTLDISDSATSAKAKVFSGYFCNDGADFTACDMAEYLVWNSALSAANLGAVFDYLSAKWAVTLA